MVILAIWIASTLFVIWFVIQVLSLMVWGVVATFIGISNRLSAWRHDSVDNRIDRERKALGYS